MEKLKLPTLSEAFLGAPGAPDFSHAVGGNPNNGIAGVGANQGGMTSMYQYSEVGDDDHDEEDEEESSEDLLDVDIDVDIFNKANLDTRPRSRIDLGSGSPHNADYYSSHGAYLGEQHTNMAKKGISTGFSYPKGVKPTNVSSVQGPLDLTVGNGSQKTGTQYGTSRPHFDQTDADSEHEPSYKFSIDDLTSTKDEMMWHSFNKQQNKIKCLLREINSLF